MILSLLLLFACLLGFFLASQRYLQIPFYLTPFFVLSTLGVAQYIVAWCGILYLGTVFIMGLGWLLLLITLLHSRILIQQSFATSLFKIHKFSSLFSFRFVEDHNAGLKNNDLPGARSIRQNKYLYDSVVLFFLLAICLYIISRFRISFSSIDEYVFWGAITRWLYIKDALPTIDTSILPRHLDYVPGLAVFHYFVLQFFQSFSIPTVKFAQALLSLATLIVYFFSGDRKTSWFYLAVSFVLASLLAGNFFFKLQSDYLLFFYFAAIFWVYFLPINHRVKYMVLFPALVYLILIKHVGLFLSVSCLVIILADQIWTHYRTNKTLLLQWFFWAMLTLTAIFLINWSWRWYCQLHEFSNFTQAITFHDVLASFNWTIPTTRQGGLRFIRDLFFAGADRLKVPYIVWYLGLIIVYRKFLTQVAINEQRRYQLIMSLLMVFGLAFIVMNYILQVAVFKLGSQFSASLSFQRYINIYFGGIAFIIIHLYMQHKSIISNKIICAAIVIASLLFLHSPIQHVLKNKQKIAEAIGKSKEAAAMITYIDAAKARHICVIDDADPEQENKLELLYYLLPHHVNYWDLFAKDANVVAVKKILSQCDYLYVRQMSEESKKALMQVIAQSYQNKQFFRVVEEAQELKLVQYF